MINILKHLVKLSEFMNNTLINSIHNSNSIKHTISSSIEFKSVGLERSNTSNLSWFTLNHVGYIQSSTPLLRFLHYTHESITSILSFLFRASSGLCNKWSHTQYFLSLSLFRLTTLSFSKEQLSDNSFCFLTKIDQELQIPNIHTNNPYL